jgi:predicted CXXCH cytochrome family protein
MNSRFKYYALALALSVFIILSCSTQKRHLVLTFIFDGVPDSTNTIVAIKDSIKADTSSANRTTEDTYNYHPPYRKGVCTDCHDKNAKDKTVVPQPELCNRCHEDFKTKFKYVHGPVRAGFCTSCHSPHMSKTKKLLIREGQVLCTYCHDIDQVKKNDVHSDIEQTNCTECHNPHGGEDHFILK